MATRVLGYKTVVEAKGTWPTNYIAKAQELKVLEDVEYKSYSDGATRGNVALLIWNMLRTNVWDVQNENETDGLTYGKTGLTMIDKYFEDYTYTTVEYSKFDIDEDGKVIVTLNDTVTDEALLETDEYEYLANDFYTFVEGTEVEVLVNEDDETLLMIVPTTTHKIVNGAKDDIDDDYEAMSADEYDYAYARVKGKEVNAASKLVTSSIHVDKLEAKKENDYIKINSAKYEDDDWSSEVVLKDGERVTLRDTIELGDILTTVVVEDIDGEKIDTFYVIGGTEVEGEFDRLAEVEYENSELTFYELTIDGDKYVVDATATYVEDPEAKTIKSESLINKSKDEMENEEVVVKLDAVTGKVVRVEFDGKIDSGSEEDTTVEFFGVTEGVDKSSKTYTIGLENENGSDDYKFAKNSDAESDAKSAYANGEDLTGALVAVTLNDEGDIEGLKVIAEYADSEDLSNVPPEVVYGVKADDEYFVIDTFESASYDKETKAIVNDDDEDESIKVNDSTVLVTLVFDDKGTEKTTDDELRIEFSDDVTDVKAEQVIAIYDANSSFVRAKYIVVFSDTSDNSDNKVGKNVSADEDALVGGNTISIEDENGEEITATVASDTEEDLSVYELLVYTITTNSKGKEIFNFVSGLATADLNEDADLIYVGECDSDRVFLLDNDSTKEVDLDDDDVVIGEDTYRKSDLEDYIVVEVNVTETEVEGQYEVDTFDTTTYEDISLVEGDRLVIDTTGEVIYVISNMDLIEEEEGNGNDDLPTTYLVTWKNGDTELTSGYVEVGTVPSCPVAEDPAKADDDTNTYEFAGWSTNKNAVVNADAPTEDEVIADGEDFPAVTADTTYYAIFTATAKTTPANE